MSERVAKVESLVQQVVARGLREELGSDSVRITVTRVDAAPDLRHAIVWLGILGNTPEHAQELFDLALAKIGPIQHLLATTITTKFVPHLTFRLDTGGAYAQEIDRMLKSV
jgi:ribosome-binding factor A